MTDEPTAASAAAVVEMARAKVNLTLQVTGRRPDGYHELESLVVFAAVGDVLKLEPADRLSLKIDGPFAAALSAGDDNLVLRAARMLAAETGCAAGAALTLTKFLPVASGIGGGSADAAAALRGLQRLWGARLPADALAALALRLGADLPVCLRSEAVIMSGIGEALQPVPALPPLWLLLANPGAALATSAVFKAREGGFSRVAEPRLPPARLDAFVEWLSLRGNDLEAPACRLAPMIAEVLAALRAAPGCLLARMSGSGATCFALFEEETAAQAGARAVGDKHPDWWLAPARLCA